MPYDNIVNFRNDWPDGRGGPKAWHRICGLFYTDKNKTLYNFERKLHGRKSLRKEGKIGVANVIVWTRAYNAEKTLRRTMDSILNQTYRDIEYHVVDNASTDETYSIIQEYAARDKRVIPYHVDINHIENSSHIILNDVLPNTKAKWFCWCDADDEYTIDFLDVMVPFVEANRLDIAACGFDEIDGLTGELVKHRALERDLILENNFAEEFISYRPFTTAVWGTLVSCVLWRSAVSDPEDDSHTYMGMLYWHLCFFAKQSGQVFEEK